MTLDPRLRGETRRNSQRGESPTLSSSQSSKRGRTDSDAKAARDSSAAQSRRSTLSNDQAHPSEPTAKRNTTLSSPISKLPPSGPSAHNSLDFQQRSSSIAKRAIVPASPTGPALLKPFTKAEDDVLMQGVALYGSRWPQVAAYFWKKAPHNPRSQESLSTRYRKHLDKRPQNGQDAEQAHQNETEPSAASQSMASGSGRSSSPPSVFSTPPLPATRAATPHLVTPQAPTRTVIPGKVWPKEEEAQLLCIALKHQSVTDVLAQVAAVFTDFRLAFPSTTRSSEAIHIKYRQLLQSMPKKEEEPEEGEIVEANEREEVDLPTAEGAKGSHELQEVEAEAEHESSADLPMADEEGVQEVTRGETPHTSAEIREEEGGDTSQSNPVTSSTGKSPAATQPQADEALPASANQPPRSPRTPEGTPPAQPQGSNIVQPTLPLLPAIDFDFYVDHLSYGLRFSRLPPNCELSTSSATRYKLRSLSPDQQPPPGAAFVFHILADGATQGLVLPPGTKTQVVVVPAADDEGTGGVGEEGGGGVGGVAGGRFVAETHFESPVDKFLVVFASPL